MNLLLEEILMKPEEKSGHIPVVLNEVLEYLALKPGDVVLDCTLGLGGHSESILQAILPGGKLIGMDRDSDSINKVRERFSRFRGGFHIFNENFINLKKILATLNIEKVDAVLLDLGLSSYQLDGERGFSFKENSFLDMRMDKRDRLSAYDIVNYYSQKDIAVILKDFGEEGFYRQISEEILSSRREKHIETTKELVDVILRAVPYFYTRRRIHPATKTFQALRIAVNRELENLSSVLRDAIDSLLPGGKIAVISFHSLEDRIVKRAFREEKKTGRFEILTPKPIVAGELELKVNSRSRSAKLRVGMKCKNGNKNLLLKIFAL